MIEDDYDAEFRYDRAPVGALQGLIPDQVAYIGTTSKSLAPGLRLAWMALPERLVEPVARAKLQTDGGTSTPLQATFAEFLANGDYDRHLRTMRHRYRRRRDALIAALDRRLPSLPVGGAAAGLHLTLGLPDGTDWPIVRAALSRAAAGGRVHRRLPGRAVHGGDPARSRLREPGLVAGRRGGVPAGPGSGEQRHPRVAPPTVPRASNTKGYTPGMSKVMISLPEDLLAQIDDEAERRSTSRSALLAAAARRELSRRDNALVAAAIERSEQRFRESGAFEAAELVRTERDARP